MKILYLSDYLSTWNMGGATRILISQLRAATKAGHEVILLSGGPREDQGALPCPWIRHTYKSITYLPSLLISLYGIKRKFQPQVLHIHQPLIGFLAILVFGRNVPRVYHFHSFWKDEKLSHAKSFFGRLLSQFKGWIENRTLKRMDHFIVLSEFSKSKLLRVVPKAKITKIPGSVDPSRFKSISKLEPKIDGAFELISVRRLDPRMGLDILLQALSLFINKHPSRRIHCTVIGEGRQRGHLEDMIRNLKLDAIVKLEGRVDETTLTEFIQRAHLSVLPTRELEGFGVSVIESLSAGTPVLATSIGALPEFSIYPEVFHAVGEAEASNLLEGLEWAWDHWRGEDLRQNCQKVVEENFSEEIISQKLLTFYNGIQS